MKLVGSKTIPYARKVRVILAEKQLACEFVEESAWNADTTVPRYNPLNKVPALVMDDGDSLYDSRVIAEYLDAISARRTSSRRRGIERARVRRDEALGDGIADAGISDLPRAQARGRAPGSGVDRRASSSKVNAGIAAVARELGRASPTWAAAQLNAGRHRLRLRAVLAGVPPARDRAGASAHPDARGVDRAHRVAALVRGDGPTAVRTPSGSRLRRGTPRRGRARPIARA